MFTHDYIISDCFYEIGPISYSLTLLLLFFFCLYFIAAQPGHPIHCQYLSEVDQVFLTDGQAVGLRKDLNGVLLLDSALQTPVTNTEEIIVIELPYLEVSCLRNS